MPPSAGAQFVHSVEPGLVAAPHTSQLAMGAAAAAATLFAPQCLQKCAHASDASPQLQHAVSVESADDVSAAGRSVGSGLSLSAAARVSTTVGASNATLLPHDRQNRAVSEIGVPHELHVRFGSGASRRTLSCVKTLVVWSPRVDVLELVADSADGSGCSDSDPLRVASERSEG
jgi:hypothetical protein